MVWSNLIRQFDQVTASELDQRRKTPQHVLGRQDYRTSCLGCMCVVGQQICWSRKYVRLGTPHKRHPSVCSTRDYHTSCHGCIWLDMDSKCAGREKFKTWNSSWKASQCLFWSRLSHFVQLHSLYISWFNERGKELKELLVKSMDWTNSSIKFVKKKSGKSMRSMRSMKRTQV